MSNVRIEKMYRTESFSFYSDDEGGSFLLDYCDYKGNSEQYSFVEEECLELLELLQAWSKDNSKRGK